MGNIIQKQGFHIRIIILIMSALFGAPHFVSAQTALYDFWLTNMTYATTSEIYLYFRPETDFDIKQIMLEANEDIAQVQVLKCTTIPFATSSSGACDGATSLQTWSTHAREGIVQTLSGSTVSLDHDYWYLFAISQSPSYSLPITYWGSDIFRDDQSVQCKYSSTLWPCGSMQAMGFSLWGSTTTISSRIFGSYEKEIDCDITAIGDCFSQIIYWAFVPDEGAVTALSDFSLASTSPAGYVYDFVELWEEASNATNTSLKFTSDLSDFNDLMPSAVFATTTYTWFDSANIATATDDFYPDYVLPGLEYGFWLAFIYYIWRRARTLV